MRGFLFALGFLTRVPVPVAVFSMPNGQARSLPWYPLVGLVLGAILVALAWLLPARMPLLTAAMVVAAWAWLTGGLHLDGLADSADAWVGGMGDRARTLAIMKDPRSGPAGVVAVVLVLLLKFAALASLLLLEAGSALMALLLAPLLARASLVDALMHLPYVRENGIGRGLPAASRMACYLALAATVLVCIAPGFHTWPPRLSLLLPGMTALAAAVIAAALWRRACRRRLDGITGDTCGALAEGVETAVLVGLACLSAWDLSRSP